MNKPSFFLLMAAIVIAVSCNNSENYSSLQHFYAQHGVPLQTYTISGDLGGSFTTPQGTQVIIPSNAFETQLGAPVTGTVTIEFKDIYKKSDMLLSNRPTNTWTSPLKSGGEFYIKATAAGQPVELAPGKKITVMQPALLSGLDTINTMEAFRGLELPDSLTAGGDFTWYPSSDDSVYYSLQNYIYGFYAFNTPVEGSWCNSDNATFFNAYPQTSLTLHSNDPNLYCDVFLFFTGINSMIHVYGNSSSYTYSYAPQGLSCTVVAIAVKDGNLYSSFMPITIGSNQTYHFNLAQTNTTDFKAGIDALN